MHHFCGHFGCSKGQPLWLWMDTSLLLWYQRNGGQALPTPLRASHKRCCWWPERRGLVRAGPVPQPRHSLFSLFLPGYIVQGARPGQDKRRAAGRAVRVPCEGVWSVCYPKTLSCFGERVAADWGVAEGGWVSVWRMGCGLLVLLWMAVCVWIGTCCLPLCAFLEPEAGCVAGVTGDLIKELRSKKKLSSFWMEARTQWVRLSEHACLILAWGTALTACCDGNIKTLVSN